MVNAIWSADLIFAMWTFNIVGRRGLSGSAEHDAVAVRRRQWHHRVRRQRRRFRGVGRSSTASLSIAGELYDVPCLSVQALSFG